MHKLNLRKVVSAAEAAKTSEERWRLISWGITFEGSIMLKASLQPEIKVTNTEMDVLTSWQAVCSDAFSDELYGSAHKHYTEFGRICKCVDIPGSKPKWDWKVTSLNECRFILEHITPYITPERKLKGAQFLLTFRSRKYGSRHTTKEHEMPCLSV